MGISIDEIRYIARLARLRFSDGEASKLTKEFESILTYFQSIENMELDAKAREEFSGEMTPVVREDIDMPFRDREKLFRNAKSMKGPYLQVPRIIE